MSDLLSIENLSVAYGRVEAVRDVSRVVPEGSIVAILGPNGAGKTTLLAAIMGVLRSRGGACFAGRPLAGRTVEARVADGLCLVPEKRELFVSMSVEDNLRLGAFRRKPPDGPEAALRRMYGLFPRLEERRVQLAGTLSGGERQMLATARALMSAPRLLMLDEPSLGLAPLVVRDIFRSLAELRDGGVSILLVEQNARAALDLADRGYVLENGTVALSGEASALRRDERVVATYLGIKAAVPA